MFGFMNITKALADENRVRILMALNGRNELCVCQLIDMLQLAPSTVSKHLFILRNARLILGQTLAFTSDPFAGDPGLAARHESYGAVRIEEMLNYFDYADPRPSDRDSPFLLHTELAPTPWSPHTRLLRVAMQAWDVAEQDLPPSNLVFLVDVSGSMNSHDKLPLLRRALVLLRVFERIGADRVARRSSVARTQAVRSRRPAPAMWGRYSRMLVSRLVSGSVIIVNCSAWKTAMSTKIINT